MDKQNTGDKIREYRKLAGLTQQELAQKSGVSMMSIRRYETGERQPDAETLSKIAKVLAVDMLEFIPDEQRRMVEGLAREFSQYDDPENKNRELNGWAEAFFEFEDTDERKSLAINALLMKFEIERTSSYSRLFEEFTKKDLIANCTKMLSYLTKEGIIEASVRIDELTHIPKYSIFDQIRAQKSTDQSNQDKK